VQLKNKIMQNKTLQNIQAQLPISLQVRIKDVLEEEDAYAADELVELCEEVLNQIAAIGFACYIQQPNQKEVYNDYLIQLFTSKGNAYNAGPLYRWAANMIKELDTELANKIKPLFWEKEDGKLVLRESFNKLSKLRNDVMHGFFVLPPERNQEEANNIATVLEELLACDLFGLVPDSNLHFLTTENQKVVFNNRWNVQEDEWHLLENAFLLGETAHKIKHQLSETFNKEQEELVQANNTDSILPEITEFTTNNSKGAMAIWQNPLKEDNTLYASTVSSFSKNENVIPVYYSIEEMGLTYTDSFLLNKIVASLIDETGETPSKKAGSDPQKGIVNLRSKTTKQVVVVINNIHTALFHPSHLLHLADFLYENNIPLIAFGVHHPWLDKFFNHSLQLDFQTAIPKEGDWLPLLDNYLRFKGPNKQLEEDKKDYEELVSIAQKAVSELSEKKKLVARHFADENNYAIEYVHEVFGILHPYFSFSQKTFELDEVDDLYGFPKELTEASSIFFAIGRRDAKLEYQHKVLGL